MEQSGTHGGDPESPPIAADPALVRAIGGALTVFATLMARKGIEPLEETANFLGIYAVLTAETAPAEGPDTRLLGGHPARRGARNKRRVDQQGRRSAGRSSAMIAGPTRSWIFCALERSRAAKSRNAPRRRSWRAWDYSGCNRRAGSFPRTKKGCRDG
jgi:hypothetical protein